MISLGPGRPLGPRFNNRVRPLRSRSPDTVLGERLKAKPELAKLVIKLPDPNALSKTLKIVAAF